jgi:hypothetical protein
MPTARLGIALTQTGAIVDALCPRGHVIRKSSIVRGSYPYKALSPLSSLREAIQTSKPDLIVSADDLTTENLIELFDREKLIGNSDSDVCKLIERSLGPKQSFQYMVARKRFMDLARNEGIRVPETAAINNADDLEAWLVKSSFPFVLKVDGSSSGEGTRIVSSRADAHRAFEFLQKPVELVRVVKRMVVNHDLRSVRPKLQGRRAIVSAQEHIVGRDATSLIACWQGKVLGALHFEVLAKQRKLGPASAMRLIDNPEIETFTANIVSKLKLSGLHGFDFLIEQKTGSVYMIEFNPRATQVGHLTLGQGKDLPGALYSAVTGTEPREAPNLTENQTIALFPQESSRDPESLYLKSGYHDVPKGQPELIRACLRQARPGFAQQFANLYSRVFSANHEPIL